MQAERQQPANSREGHLKPAKGISLQALPVTPNYHGYSPLWVLPNIMGAPVTVGTPTCRHSPLSRVLIVVGTPHYREYSPISRVLPIVGTPFHQGCSP